MKKYAQVYFKNNLTGQLENEGMALLLSCMDHQGEKSFYELRFLNNMSDTACRWVNNSDIFYEE